MRQAFTQQLPREKSLQFSNSTIRYGHEEKKSKKIRQEADMLQAVIFYEGKVKYLDRDLMDED